MPLDSSRPLGVWVNEGSLAVCAPVLAKEKRASEPISRDVKTERRMGKILSELCIDLKMTRLGFTTTMRDGLLSLISTSTEN
jgi:hypothetical protein